MNLEAQTTDKITSQKAFEFSENFKTPRDIIRFAFKKYKNRPAFTNDRGAITYGELETRVLKLSAFFEQSGLTNHDLVASVLPPSGQEFIELRLAVLESGSPATMIDVPLPVPALIKLLEVAQARMLIYDPAMLIGSIDELKQALPQLKTIAIGPEGEYNQLLEQAIPKQNSREISPDDLAAFGFTSGTTGQPKELSCSQAALVHSCRIMLNEGAFAATSDSPGTFLYLAPIGRSGTLAILPTMFQGMHGIVLPEFDACEALRVIEKQRVTLVFLTPSMLIDILDVPELEKHDLSALEQVVYGSAVMPAAKIEEAIRRIGPVFVQGYGMSEVLAPLSVLRAAEHLLPDGKTIAPQRILNSIGKPVKAARVKVINRDGESAKPGEIGDIYVSSPTMFSGYRHNPELNKTAFRNGMFNSGDVGYFDAEGWLHLLDRKADIIERNGSMIYPRKIEEEMHYHRAIKEACVVSPDNGRTIVAAVSLRQKFHDIYEPGILEKELQEQLRNKFGQTELPDRVIRFPELSRSFAGKVLKREVKEVVQKRYRLSISE